MFRALVLERTGDGPAAAALREHAGSGASGLEACPMVRATRTGGDWNGSHHELRRTEHAREG